MNILILTPTAFPSITGNAMTVERWRVSLGRMGHAVSVLATENLDVSKLRDGIDRSRPDLIHAHHLMKSGALLLSNPTADRIAEIPVVVSPAGTDIEGGPGTHWLSEEALAVCHRSQAIITQSRWLYDLLARTLTGMKNRVTLIPKAFQWMGNDPWDLRAHFHWSRDEFVFFFPAGVRPVKNNLECLRWIERLHRSRNRVRIVFAGPALDQTYATAFEKEIRRCSSFARWTGTIPPSVMRSAYDSVDVVLNASRSEGFSNILLEAMAAGRPLLASRIPGNVEPLKGDGEREEAPCRYLFDVDDPEDFLRKAARLVDDAAYRRGGVLGCRDRAARLPSPDEEARALSDVYGKVLKSSRESGVAYASSTLSLKQKGIASERS